MKTKKVKKKKINIARVLVLILFIYIIVCVGLYIYKEPIAHYEITGNNLVTDADILRSLNLTDYPSYVSLNTRKAEKKLENNPLIKEAKVSYGWNFYINIDIKENRPMFVVKPLNKICLADGTLIDYSDDYVNLPTLLNQPTEEVLTLLAKGLSEVDEGVLYTISEIEYKPSYSKDNKVIDANRFLLAMKDKNLVYITAKKAKVLNLYLDIIATKQLTFNATFFLDSGDTNATVKKNNTTEPVASTSGKGSNKTSSTTKKVTKKTTKTTSKKTTKKAN